MTGNGPELVVRVSANLSELKTALAEGVTQFETTRSALNQMSNAFDGSRTLAQAGAVVGAIMQIGDVTKLTAAEQAKANTILEAGLAKYQALGREAPPGMRELADATKQVAVVTKQAEDTTTNWTESFKKLNGILTLFGVGLSIGAIVNLGRALLDDADNLTKLHDKTGISVEGLQALRIAGDDAGVAIDEMTAAVNMLQKRLGGDDQSANKALTDLRINIGAFKQMDGAQQLDAISKAIQGIDDPLRVAADLSALFGKQWAEQLPVLKRGFAELETGSGQMSTGTVKALDDAGDAVGRFWRSVKANIGEAVADVLTGSLSDWRQLNAEIAKLPAIADADKMKNFWGAMAPPGLPADLDDITAKLDAQIKAQIKTTEAMVELNSVGSGWLGTLNTISGSVAEAVKYYLQAGVAQDKLATVYGLTAAQVKAVASELTEEQKALKLQASAVEQVTQLWDEYNQMASKGGTALDDQVAAIDRWAADLTAKAQKAGTDTAGFYEALTELWNAKLHQASEAASTAIVDVADTARSAFAEMNDEVMGITSDFDGWNDAIMNVQQSLDGAIESTKALAAERSKGSTLDVAHAAQDPRIMAFLKAGWSLANAVALKQGEDWGFTPKLYDALGNPETAPSKGERVPGYKDGVMDAPGGWAMVGERGPELMRVPRGADIYPTGTGPGGTQTINLVVDGRVLASVVADQTMQRQRNIGVRY